VERLNAVHQRIAGARVRSFASRSALAFSYVLPVLAVICIAAALAGRVAGLSGAWVFWVPFSLVLAALVGCLLYASAGQSAANLAGRIDRRAALKDRFSNALEFAARKGGTPLMELAIADAEANARSLRIEPFFPVWTPGNGKRLAWLVLLLPLFLSVLFFDISGLFHPKKTTDPIQAAWEQAPEALGESPFDTDSELDAPLVAPARLRGVLDDWRSRLEALRKRPAEKKAALPPPPPETIHREDLKAGPTIEEAEKAFAVDHLPTVMADGRLRASDIEALKFLDDGLDQSIRGAFEKLDEVVGEDEPTLGEVEKYIQSLKQNSVQRKQSSQVVGQMADIAAAKGEGDYKANLQSVQQDSVSEFLNQYALHLGRVVEGKKGALKKHAAGKVRRKVVQASGEQKIPEDAEMQLVRMTPEMRRGIKMNMAMQESKGRPGGEGSGQAGRGGGTARGSIKVEHVRSVREGPTEALHGKVGEGRAPLQILEDVEPEGRDAYDKLFGQFQAEALRTLEDKSIPVFVRAYVQRYLESIRPEAEKKVEP